MRPILTLPADLWASGGFTLPLNYQGPPARFLVSDRGGVELAEEPTEAELAAFVRARWAELARPGAFLGGWRSPEGRYFLDVTRSYVGRETALAEGARNGQRAIWDREAGEAVDVPAEAVL
jgi:hypothetical protein